MSSEQTQPLDEKTVEKDSQKEEKKEIDLRKSIIIPDSTTYLRSDVMLAKKRKAYDLEDEELTKITLDNDIVVKLIANNKGVFVDVRKYYKGYPTKKGIRIIATKFIEVSKMLENDINKMTK